jgi:predicted permease
VSLLSIFATAILPIVAIAAAGFLLGRVREIEADPLNTVTIYVLAPALVFYSLATTELGGTTLLAIGLGVLAVALTMTAIAEGLFRTLGETEPVLGTAVLVSVFPNAANYGIPVSEFAFGAVGRATAVVFIAAEGVVMYTLGVYLAARGDGDDWRQGVRSVFTIPLVYAVAAAGLARLLGVVPPTGSSTMETIKLVGDAAIPVMLLILGIELAGTDYGAAVVRVSPAVALKMGVAPVVAVGVVLGLGSVVGFGDSTVARVFVLECSMPAAVTPLILTGEFAGETDDDIDPRAFASTAILVSTLLSVPLLTVLIAVLESGVVV